MAIRFLSSETIDGALTVNSTVTLNKTDNVISIPSLVDNGKFLSVTQTGNETWDFKCESLSGSLDGVTIGTTAGKVAFDENGQIHSIQLLDVATAGGRLIGESSRGYVSSIHLEQTATNTDGGYIRFETAPSGSTTGVERLRITDTGAFSVGSTGTNYGTSGQVLTSGGNSNPTWTTPTTGTVTGTGVDNRIAIWNGTTAIDSDSDFYVDGDTIFTTNLEAFGTGTFSGVISGPSIDLSNFAQIKVDDAEIYWTNTANNDYWRWRRDASNNFILDHYNGTSTTPAVTFFSSQNLTFTGTVKTSGASMGTTQADGDYLAKLETLNADGFLKLYTGQGTPLERIRISSYGDSFFVPAASGKIGIGTTSPNSILHVGSTGANAYSSTITKGSNMKGIMNALSNNADDMVGIYFATGTTTEGTHWSGITGSRSDSATHWGTQLNFYTHADDVANLNDATQKMVILGDGEVGIGTTSPTATLQVGGGSANVLHKIWGSGTAGIQIFTNSPSTGTKIVALEQYFSNEGYLGLYYNGTEKVRLRANDTSFLNGGRLGIGTTNPGRMLGVNGGSTQDGGIQLETTATATNFWSGIEFKTPNATSFMYVSSGDAAGTLKFVPAGSLKASLNATSFICAGDVVAYGSPSDITLKKNIKPLENSLDKIKNLQGVSFTWKNPGLSNIVDDIGFIAQDVKEVVPKLVRENEDGKLSMRHQGVIPILVEAMKEQQKQIDRLEEQIKKMSSKN